METTQNDVMKGGDDTGTSAVNLIAGLGNPGAKYSNTRHNIGYKVIDQVIRNFDVCLDIRRFQSVAVCSEFSGKDILLIKPLTFMNLSGDAVAGWADLHNIGPENILVVHDDIDLPLGKIKAVRSGGAGGHRGVRSIINSINSMEFPRVKIGIGRPRYGENIEDFVLTPFYDDENEILESVILTGAKACQLFISKGIEFVMNNINCQYFENEEVIS